MPRAIPAAVSVTGPTSAPASRSATLLPGAAPAAPMLKTRPPDTGWPSAETTR